MDSDIYTLPIDVIHQEEERLSSYRHHHRAMSDNNLLGCSSTRSHKFHRSKNKRSKRKKRSDGGHESRKMSSGNVVSSQSFTVSHEYNRVTSSDKAKAKLHTSNISNNNSSALIDNSMKNRAKSRESDGAKIIKGDSNNNSKYASTANVKKSQFSISLNLKQKFCSIFRFRKSHQPPAVAPPTQETGEKKVNLSTRALPPLPGLGEF